MLETISIVLLAIAVTFLIIIQYTMVISDWIRNESETWEKVVGVIPFGPYVLMLLTAVWYIFKKIFKR
jgi:hypothetical protein